MEYLKFVDEIEKDVQQDDSSSLGEKLIIYSIIRAIKPSVCVETGTHKGKTALYIAQALYDNKKGHLWTAENNDRFAEESIRYFSRYPELSEFITFEKIKGEDLKIKIDGISAQIDFAFIDSFHEKEVVLAEIKALFPQLSKHAIVIFHDCDIESGSQNGVNQAIEKAGLKTLWMPTQNNIRIYQHSKL